MNLTEYDISHPFRATVVKSERITDPKTDEVRHITLNIADTSFHYLEGQSVGVLVPGPHPFGNKHHLRLYSIASSRQGEHLDLAEISLCVRRCFYIDEVSGERFPGIASNFLCDARPGDSLLLTGPYGRHFIPPRDLNANILMIGIGTGIAPFRAFLKHIYEERKGWKGTVRLFYGARTGLDLLYMNDRNNDLSLYYDQDTFRAIEALSPRPHADAPVDMDRSLLDNTVEVAQLIRDNRTFVFVSGLAKLEHDLDQTLAEILAPEQAWPALKQTMIAQGRWATLFYD